MRGQAEKCRERKFFLREGNLIFYDPALAQKTSYFYSIRKEEPILEALRLGDDAGLGRLLKELATEIRDNQQSLTAQDVKQIYKGLLEYQ